MGLVLVPLYNGEMGRSSVIAVSDLYILPLCIMFLWPDEYILVETVSVT